MLLLLCVGISRAITSVRNRTKGKADHAYRIRTRFHGHVHILTRRHRGHGGPIARSRTIAKLAKSSALALKKAGAKAAAAIGRRGGNASGARLRASNAAFSAYRLDQCAFAMATIGGAGNARDTTRLTCLTKKNLQRARELARETHDLSRK